MDPVRPALQPRERTRATLLGLIRHSEGLTRSDLVAATGLSRSTVTHAVRSLLAAGKVVETGVAAKGPGSGSGRPGVRLRAVATGGHVAGVDFGHTHLAVTLADAFGAEVARESEEIDVDVSATDALDRGAAVLRSLVGRAGITELAGVVMGLPMPIDARNDRVRMPTSLSSWGDLRPAARAQALLGVPVHVENDAVLGAYGELRRGAGRGLTDFLYVKASHGVGAALVLAGAPYRGAHGLAGDIGHDKVPDRSELCRCGARGCVEAVVSLDAVRAQVAHTHPGVDPAEVVFDVIDGVTEKLLSEAGRILGRVVAEHSNMLNPQAVIVGGVLARIHPAFVEGIVWSMRELGRPAVAADTRVLPGSLGERAGVVGAVQMAADRLAAGGPAPGGTGQYVPSFESL